MELASIPEERLQSWNFEGVQIQDGDFRPRFDDQKIIDWAIKDMASANVGLDEVQFGFYAGTEDKKVYSVLSDNIANWMGYDSLVADNGDLGFFHQ